MADDPKGAAERKRLSGPPTHTLMQWKPPAAATHEGLSVERLRVPAPLENDPSAQPGTSHSDSNNAELGAFAKTENLSSLSLPPPAPLVVGDIIGDRYVVEQHISSGGFGSVYRASDKQISNHQVALKLLHKPAASDEERESALRELTLIASVSHPSVVQFKDYGWRDGCLWFAMPWYRGHTLAERLAGVAGVDDGPVPMKRIEAHPIFERLAQGLAAMHDVGIHHHDIKPENVFLADIAGFSGGLPVLLDLGISTKRGEKPKGLTIEYASPETAAAALGEPVGPIGAPADVFSLALVLRNALEPSTAPAMDADNALALLQRRANVPVEPPKARELRYLKPHFARWLSLTPDERPTAEELAREFVQLIEPEERRKARVRLLRRLVPIVIVAATIVAGLWYQLRQQATVLQEQQTALTKEKQESQQIRRESETQLKQLERKNATALGTERQRLEEAIGIARSLDKQLARAERESDTLGKRVDRLVDDRSRLTNEKAVLSGERDQLARARDLLASERDGLVSDRNRLNAERNALIAQRDDLDRRADALSRERDVLSADLSMTKSEATLAKNELRTVQSELTELRNERKALSRRVSDLQEERDRIEAIRRSLERQLSALDKGRPPQQPRPSPAPEPAQPSETPSQPRPSRPTLDPTQTGPGWR